jgi:hypothetical protein
MVKLQPGNGFIFQDVPFEVENVESTGIILVGSDNETLLWILRVDPDGGIVTIKGNRIRDDHRPDHNVGMPGSNQRRHNAKGNDCDGNTEEN